MTLQLFLIWMAIGLVAGWLASAVIGGGYGVVGDIVVGLIGSFIGSLIFNGLRWHAPFAGLPGTIFVAFVGALALLIILRLVRSTSARRL